MTYMIVLIRGTTKNTTRKNEEILFVNILTQKIFFVIIFCNNMYPEIDNGGFISIVFHLENILIFLECLDEGFEFITNTAYNGAMNDSVNMKLQLIAYLSKSRIEA